MQTIIKQNVATALAEDIGTGDITSILIPVDQTVTATIMVREPAIICGIEWATETFNQVDERTQLRWHVRDGEKVAANTILCEITGFARSILTAERTALNFLQTLSGTATLTARYVEKLQGTSTKLLDTRKTIPGLRHAQKYAVHCGGGYNHRIGLYDAYLIKENHIMSCGSIQAAVTAARQQHPDKLLEVEVENLDELQQALSAGVSRILLDNFDLTTLKQAVQFNQHRAELETSGNIHLDNIDSVVATGVDYISVGSITKHVQAIDMTLRLK